MRNKLFVLLWSFEKKLLFEYNGNIWESNINRILVKKFYHTNRRPNEQRNKKVYMAYAKIHMHTYIYSRNLQILLQFRPTISFYTNALYIKSCIFSACITKVKLLKSIWVKCKPSPSTLHVAFHSLK